MQKKIDLIVSYYYRIIKEMSLLRTQRNALCKYYTGAKTLLDNRRYTMFTDYFTPLRKINLNIMSITYRFVTR